MPLDDNDSAAILFDKFTDVLVGVEVSRKARPRLRELIMEYRAREERGRPYRDDPNSGAKTCAIYDAVIAWIDYQDARYKARVEKREAERGAE